MAENGTKTQEITPEGLPQAPTRMYYAPLRLGQHSLLPQAPMHVPHAPRCSAAG